MGGKSPAIVMFFHWFSGGAQLLPTHPIAKCRRCLWTSKLLVATWRQRSSNGRSKEGPKWPAVGWGGG